MRSAARVGRSGAMAHPRNGLRTRPEFPRDLARLAGRPAAAASPAFRVDRSLAGRGRRPAAKRRHARPSSQPLAQSLAAQWVGLLPGVHRLVFEGGRVLLTLHVRDVKAALREPLPPPTRFFSTASIPSAIRRCGTSTRSKASRGIAAAARGSRPGPWPAPCGADSAQCGFVGRKARRPAAQATLAAGRVRPGMGAQRQPGPRLQRRRLVASSSVRAWPARQWPPASRGAAGTSPCVDAGQGAGRRRVRLARRPAGAA